MENIGEICGRARIFVSCLHALSTAIHSSCSVDNCAFRQVKLQKGKVDHQLYPVQWLRMRGNLSNLPCTSSGLDVLQARM
jgi:hypothetical protein